MHSKILIAQSSKILILENLKIFQMTEHVFDMFPVSKEKKVEKHQKFRKLLTGPQDLQCDIFVGNLGTEWSWV